MQIHLLGPLAVTRDGAEVDLGRRHHRLLLARLLVDPGRTVSVDQLLEDIWSGAPPAGATASVQSYVSRLRRLLEPDRAPRRPAEVLVTRAGGYAVQIDADAMDATRFESLARAGHDSLATGDAVAALGALEAGLALWRGPVLADLADESFVTALAVRLGERRRQALRDRAAARIALGDLASAIAELDLLVTEDPLDEQPWELLVTALHRAGRTAEALQRLRQVRDVMADELGLDPGAGLQDLEQAILAGAELPHAGPVPVPAPTVSPPPPAARETGLVGREDELRQLTDVLADVRSGRTRWVVVSGEPGIGKTRLVEVLAATAAASGIAVGWGRAHEEDGAPALWPWVQVLRDLGEVMPDAAPLLAPVPGEAGETGDVFALFDRIATEMVTAARTAPLLCVLDDLQWADAETLGLVTFLAVQLRDAPIAVVVTVRSGDGRAAAGDALSALARTRGALRIDLEGLDPESSAALAGSVAGAPLDPAPAAALHARTSGNPFFLTEMARLGAHTPGAALPATVRGVLSRRLGDMPEATTSLLELAAVAGLDAGVDLLAAASGADVEALLDALEPALAAALLVVDARGSVVRFRHALLRDAVLADLAHGHRRRLHLRLATAARQLTADPTFAVAEVAHHMVEAGPLGDTAATLSAVRAATDQATRRLAFHEAARWAERGLEVVQGDRRIDQRERHAFLLAAGRSLADAGERDRGLERLAEAVEAGAALGDARLMAEAAIAFSRAGQMWYWVAYHTRPTRLIRLLDQTLDALGPDDSADRVRVLGVRAIGDYYADPASARALAAEALAAARRIGDPDLVIDALLNDVMAGWGPVDIHDLVARSRELLELAVAHRRRDTELAAWVNLYVHQLVTGDLAAAEEAHRRAWQLAESQGLALAIAQLGWGRALFAQARGELHRVEELIRSARRLHERTQLYALEAAHAQQIVLLRWEQGRLAEVADRLGHSLGWVDLTGEEIRALLAGRVGDALSRRMADLAGQQLRPSYESLGALVLRARLLADALQVDPGLADAARVIIPQLQPFEGLFGSMGTVASTGPVDLQLGRLHALLGDVDDAHRLLERGREHCRRQSLPLWSAHCDRELASLAAHGSTAG